jgi:uncharacterized protein (DUF362 family)
MSLVSLVRVSDSIEEAVFKACNLAELEKVIGAGERVLVKPNICTATSREGVNTNPAVVKALIRILGKIGTTVVIGESPIVGEEKKDFFGISNYRKLAEEERVELIDFTHDEIVEINIPKAELYKKARIAKSIFKADKVISVPVMKTHLATKVTLSLKNMKGCLPGKEKWDLIPIVIYRMKRDPKLKKKK